MTECSRGLRPSRPSARRRSLPVRLLRCDARGAPLHRTGRAPRQRRPSMTRTSTTMTTITRMVHSMKSTSNLSSRFPTNRAGHILRLARPHPQPHPPNRPVPSLRVYGVNGEGGNAQGPGQRATSPLSVYFRLRGIPPVPHHAASKRFEHSLTFCEAVPGPLPSSGLPRTSLLSVSWQGFVYAARSRRAPSIVRSRRPPSVWRCLLRRWPHAPSNSRAP
jgi:hypothetical protein